MSERALSNYVCIFSCFTAWLGSIEFIVFSNVCIYMNCIICCVACRYRKVLVPCQESLELLGLQDGENEVLNTQLKFSMNPFKFNVVQLQN